MLDDPALCRGARGGDTMVPAGTDWLDVYNDAMTAIHGPKLAAE